MYLQATSLQQAAITWSSIQVLMQSRVFAQEFSLWIATDPGAGADWALLILWGLLLSPCHSSIQHLCLACAQGWSHGGSTGHPQPWAGGDVLSLPKIPNPRGAVPLWVPAGLLL